MRDEDKKANKSILTPAVLADFLDGNRQDVESIQIHNDGTIELYVYSEQGNKDRKRRTTKKVRVSNQIFIKPQTERVHFTGLIKARTSGKKRFYHFGSGDRKETYTTKRVDGKLITTYTGQRDDKPSVGRVLYSLEIEGLKPIPVQFHYVSYWKYDVKNSDGTITEVYCAGHNPKLIRFVKYPDRKGFDYLR